MDYGLIIGLNCTVAAGDWSVNFFMILIDTPQLLGEKSDYAGRWTKYAREIF
jgi:hypothetical protein